MPVPAALYSKALSQPRKYRPVTTFWSTKLRRPVGSAQDASLLDAMRERGADEFGNPWKPRHAAGWEPLRCCLRKARAGEDIALISYSPWTDWTPWAEAGPVFVHFGR